MLPITLPETIVTDTARLGYWAAIKKRLIEAHNALPAQSSQRSAIILQIISHVDLRINELKAGYPFGTGDAAEATALAAANLTQAGQVVTDWLRTA